MCTVVIRVPEPGEGPTRILAVRDEDPDRPWRPLGHWWPDHPGVRGIMDELAGGAWLAADDSRLAVLLNRPGGAQVPVPTSRGGLVLDAVAGRPLPEPLTTLGFNLVDARPHSASITSWEGGHPRRIELSPGTHMVAHEDVDDPTSPRIAAWLDAFAEAPTEETDGAPWWKHWMAVLERTTRMDPTDDRAIIRDNRPHGFPTLSLLVAAASLDEGGVDVSMDVLDQPGGWSPLRLTP